MTHGTTTETPQRDTPQIGQVVTLYGKRFRIFAIHRPGTIDVEEINGPSAFRITGLAF